MININKTQVILLFQSFDLPWKNGKVAGIFPPGHFPFNYKTQHNATCH